MPATLEQLQQYLEKTNRRDHDPLLKRFSELIFEKASPDFLQSFEAEGLMALASNALRLMHGKASHEIRVRAYNPSYPADGWEAPYTALELTLTDRPFIVDSVRAELRRQGFELHHLLHPIIGVIRDDQGRVDQVTPSGHGETQEVYELYLIDREEDETRRHALIEAVERVLNDVVLATSDYHAMCEKSQALGEYLDRLHETVETSASEFAEELAEYAAFMRWLVDDNFVFLGYREYEIVNLDKGDEIIPHLQVVPDSALGILQKLGESAYQEPVPLAEISEGLRERVIGGKTLVVTKTNAESTVHRPARMDYVGIKKLGKEWQVKGEQRVVGLFTSKALSTAVDEIPILRRKLRQVLELDKVVPGSHDYKQITAIFNSMPREELFWAEAKRLHKDIRTIMGMAEERSVRITVRPDPLARGLAVMVIMPRERFNTDVRRKIQHMLYDKLEAKHVDYQLAMGEDEDQVRFHFFFTTDKGYAELDVPALEQNAAELARTWEDHLYSRLLHSKGEMMGRRLAERYLHAFDERYKADTPSSVVLRDIEDLEALGKDEFLADIVKPTLGQYGDDATNLKIYHRRRSLVLSEVLPILENLGFKVLEQISYVARLPFESGPEVRGIDIFRVQDQEGRPLDVRAHGKRLQEALEQLLAGRAENDRLNRLVLYGGLSVRQVALLRAYQMYYAQLSATTSRRFVNDTLLHYPLIAALLYQAFEARFDPALEQEEREARAAEIKERFSEALAEVPSLPEDRTLRGIFNLIEASVRSNYFLPKEVISFKVDSSRVDVMPEPVPYCEIAVAGPKVEGTHLRGGKVARGGIRWSDRPDDFRTEVLGLMKTQMTKNAVIVPVGSKGGFVVKHPPGEREALRAYVEAQYQSYIRALLELTDNMVDGEVVHPEGLVIYDDPDPYLVVAADKGTATFSDLANRVAAEYDFWLADAFASGGSHGYDHKKEGITARGAWESVKRHFRELGKNVHEEPFTVVGIGDMAGDVFGNGMLYSEQIRLLAAFNHLHVFLDPDPDPAASYQERKRLFELPRSSWQDYDPELISEGGGVYPRSAKSIPLTPQVKEALGLSADALSGQELIKAIVRAPVELLWNGGIGTYVKASSERHAEVGDSSNDGVRVDANELRAKVFGEGGNLGFTQLARIEYARHGGRINTDAIDNSGGVDMSDHEVNIKILLQPLLRDGTLSFQQRNQLLEEMTDEVSELVLSDNYHQSLAISLAERRAHHNLGLFESQQGYLAEYGGLKPEVEYLPSARTYQERQRSGEGLTRPELAILLAYTKMGIYRRLLETDLGDDPYFEHYLAEYFPQALQARFPEAIASHPLRREITATQFTNTVVDLLGITFVHRSLRETGASAVETIRAALIALDILEVKAFAEGIAALDDRLPAEAQYHALSEMVRAVEGVVNWILLSDLPVEPIGEFVACYREPLQQLKAGLESLLPTDEKERYHARRQEAEEAGLPPELARELASLDYLPSGMGVVDVNRTAKVSLEAAAEYFYTLGERLSLGWIRDHLALHQAESKWEKIALVGLIMDLRRAQLQLTNQYIHELRDGGARTPEAFLKTHERLLGRYDGALEDIRENDTLDVASAGVLARMLTQILEESQRTHAVAA